MLWLSTSSPKMKKPTVRGPSSTMTGSKAVSMVLLTSQLPMRRVVRDSNRLRMAAASLCAGLCAARAILSSVNGTLGNQQWHIVEQSDYGQSLHAHASGPMKLQSSVISGSIERLEIFPSRPTEDTKVIFNFHNQGASSTLRLCSFHLNVLLNCE